MKDSLIYKILLSNAIDVIIYFRKYLINVSSVTSGFPTKDKFEFNRISICGRQITGGIDKFV